MDARKKQLCANKEHASKERPQTEHLRATYEAGKWFNRTIQGT